ncbi:MAG: DNA polymerase Y family protein, partial [Pseudomonadales bacterium]|nr:DNA polymerase Y family protein [Pseudomonadales bacterium]
DQVRTQTDGHAFAVVSEEGGRSVVIACNQAANDCGIQAGMALSAAYALIPELKLVAQNKAQEQEVLKRLAGWAKKYTPMVSLQSPESMLLEIRGSLALFGGLQALLQKLKQDIHALGLQHYHAIAPTPTAALWLCRHHSGHIAADAAQLHTELGELPVTCTGWAADTLTRLRGMGIHRLRDCLRLPRDGFARRIGKQRLAELDRALGKAPDPRENYQTPERYVARREFLFALDKLDMIFNGLEQLLRELTGFLCGRQSGIQKLRVRLYHQDAPASVVELGMAAVCRDEQRLASLLHQKLEQLELPEPVVAVTMESGLLYPLAGSDGDLFDDAAHHEVHWPELVEKLRARLGVRAVTGLCLVPEHRPEQAWKYA